ncbi:MAG: SAM-dependent methyltransferase, partial [Deltaproteobacteria bacterium]|nr:SAM-dependent methyltransferase [Deltaproteobacteria bacterium]
VTFAEFMEAALYLPGKGYYTSAEKRWGERGDYITNCDVSPIFARMLAKAVCEMWLFLGSPREFHLVEAGAGRGLLTEGILAAIDGLYPRLSGCLKVSLVEKNPMLRKPPGERTAWYEDISGLKGPFTGCVYSQELLDSLPFHRVVMREDGLKEVYVGYGDGRFFDAEGRVSTERLPEYFNDLGITLENGQGCEVGLLAKQWVRTAGGLLDRGFVVTVDYGMPARSLYRAGRAGTLVCHFRHTINDDPYRMVGMQDITCHVDFTAIRDGGFMAGLTPTGFTTQRNFLIGMGILEELKEVHDPAVKDYETIRHNQGIKELVMPGGIGDAMKVFIQHKGVGGKEPKLRGFSFRDMKEGL